MHKTILQISWRNLIRQKRRSLLLGIAIAFGAMILVVANSFSRGISDVLFNQIVVYVSGHVSVNFAERGNFFRQIFYNKEHIDTVIDRTIAEVTAKEEAIGIFARAIGNGASDNVILVGMDLDAEISREEAERAAQNFRMVEGSFSDLRDSTKENPVIIAQTKAAYLNVQRGDILRTRFTTARGQDQAARLTVVGIFKPSNPFMAFPIFVELENLKPLMGYAPHHTASMQINIEHPKKDAARLADSLHKALQPRPALIPARIRNTTPSMTPLQHTGHIRSPGGASPDSARAGPVALVGFTIDSSAKLLLDSLLTLHRGRISFDETMVTRAFATRFHVDTADTVHFSAMDIHTGKPYTAHAVIAGIVTIARYNGPAILMNPEDFYRHFYTHWPRPDPTLRRSCGLMDTTHPYAAVIAPEWELLERSRTTEQTQKRFREMAQANTKAVVVDVRSMYETASAVLQLEGALNLITVIAVMVLFFIILIGVINTLRMAVRERTREIGTIRAIGMRRGLVRDLFITETTMLAFFASIAGSILAFGVMWLLSLPVIDASDNPMGMLLVNGHLHFAPSWISILGFIALICAITALTAWGPARRAARMRPCDALRHFE